MLKTIVKNENTIEMVIFQNLIYLCLVKYSLYDSDMRLYYK